MFSKSGDLIIFKREAQKVRILLKMTLGRAQAVAEIAFRRSPRASGAQGGRPERQRLVSLMLSSMLAPVVEPKPVKNEADFQA